MKPFPFAARAAAVRNAKAAFEAQFAELKRLRGERKASAKDIERHVTVVEAARSAYFAALEAAYPPGFWSSVEQLQSGDPGGLDVIVAFLEADPWFFRSGYAKAEALKRMRKVELPRNARERLKFVVLAAVDTRDRKEFRWYCRLAKRIDDHELRTELANRIARKEPGIARRAAWVLSWIFGERQPSRAERLRARQRA